MIYDTPLAGARVRQPIRVTHSGEEGLMQWSQLRSVFFICFNEGAHRKTGVSDGWCVRTHSRTSYIEFTIMSYRAYRR